MKRGGGGREVFGEENEVRGDEGGPTMARARGFREGTVKRRNKVSAVSAA